MQRPRNVDLGYCFLVLFFIVSILSLVWWTLDWTGWRYAHVYELRSLELRVEVLEWQSDPNHTNLKAITSTSPSEE